MRQLQCVYDAPAPNNNFLESRCNVIYSHKVGRYDPILPPPLFSLNIYVHLYKVGHIETLYADWTQLNYSWVWWCMVSSNQHFGSKSCNWLPVWEAVVMFASVGSCGDGCQCGKLWWWLHALLVEANNGEYYGGGNLMQFYAKYTHPHPHPHAVTQKQQHYIIPTYPLWLKAQVFPLPQPAINLPTCPKMEYFTPSWICY